VLSYAVTSIYGLQEFAADFGAEQGTTSVDRYLLKNRYAYQAVTSAGMGWCEPSWRSLLWKGGTFSTESAPTQKGRTRRPFFCESRVTDHWPEGSGCWTLDIEPVIYEGFKAAVSSGALPFRLRRPPSKPDLDRPWTVAPDQP
jgi:hypothetical protein